MTPSRPWAVLAGTMTGPKGRTFVLALVGTGELVVQVKGME